MPYVHLCFIPVFPVGKKQFEVRCKNCGDDTFYLFSALLLAACVGSYWFYWNNNNQKNRDEFVANPKVGDVYSISESRNDRTAYYFLRVAEIKGDKAAQDK